MVIEPYFGMSRTMYLQTLCNKWGDYGVSWNWWDKKDKAWRFTKKRRVLAIWSDKPSVLERVQHREAMPIETFVEVDDEHPVSYLKMQHCIGVCETYGLEYCVYKSRKGYHISVLDPQQKLGRRNLIKMVNSDKQFLSPKPTWSLEWSAHWKQPDFIIEPIHVSKNYQQQLLG